MGSSEFTPRKVRRKLQSDGVLSVGVTAADLFIRKRVGRLLFDPAVERGIVRTLSREEFKSQAVESMDIIDDATEEPSPFVSRFENGYVLTETGLLMTNEFEIVEESAATPEQAQQAMMAMCSRELFFGYLPIRSLLTGEPTAEPEVLDTVAPLIPRYPTNYYHWMVETVPKVRYLRAFEERTGADVTVLVPSRGASFIDETLDLLDWPEAKIVCSAEPVYEVRNLVVPSFPERTLMDFNWLRGEVLDTVSTEEETTDKSEMNNVYVSRANAIERRVVNEDEVMDVLSDYGFERYCLESLSLAENLHLFNHADVVVGPHGAGLTDIIFAEDCTLIELFGEKIKEPYELLADTLAVDYEPMYCQTDSADILVDTEELERRISKLVENSCDGH